MPNTIERSELNKQIAQIRRNIVLSMNGEVSIQMRRNGIVYERNYGVDIPRLKQIAAKYSPNHELAQALWQLKIRESMILASLLEPIEEFTMEDACNWLKDFSHTEIIEQVSQNLLSKLTFAESLCLDWANSKDTKAQTTAFFVAARIYNKLTTTTIKILIDRAVELSDTESHTLSRSIAVCLGRFCRIDNEILTYVETALKNIKKTELSKSIEEEVRQEITFLRNVNF